MAIRRRLQASLITLVLAVAAVVTVVHAPPAAAAPSVNFEEADGLIWGTVTFNNSHKVTIKGNIYGDPSAPTYFVKGVYFEGNAHIVCVRTTEHRNSIPDIQRSYTDILDCNRANIQQVEILCKWGGRPYSVCAYFANPLAP
jgi:hypothetical protein